MMIGQKISNYVLEDKIGEGGFGDVFRARDENTGMEVAIKCSRADEEKPLKDFEQRFLREVSCISKLRHPSIVQLFDYGALPDGTLYLVMEYVCGLNLEVLIKRDAPYSYESACRIILQILDALKEAHQQGIVHRDLKPANIMLVRQGMNQEVVKLLDFGIAKAFDGTEPDLTQQSFSKGAGFGTPQYMPPEQFYGKKVGPYSDLYAVGLLFLELLTGKQAMTGQNLSEIVEHQLKNFPDIPKPFCEGPLFDVFRLALAKDPEMRYQSAEQMYNDICAIFKSPFLARYKSVNNAPTDSVSITIGSAKNVASDNYQDFDMDDEDSTVDTMLFEDQQQEFAEGTSTDIGSFNTMIFASDINSPAYPQPPRSLYDEFQEMEENAPTDDMSRVNPSVTMSKNAYSAPPLPAYAPPAPPPFDIRNCETQCLDRPAPPGPPKLPPHPVPAPDSEEINIETTALEAHPEFADLPNRGLVRVNANNELLDDELGVQKTRMLDASIVPQFDDDDDPPPVFHQQRTQFLAKRQLNNRVPTAMGDENIFSRIKYRIRMSDTGIKFMNSGFARAAGGLMKRISLFIDMLYERHFIGLVVTVCLLLIALMLILGWLLFV